MIKQFFKRCVDYFTANSCRKIFFMSVVIAVLLGMLAAATQVYAVYLAMVFTMVVAAVSSLGDSMITRRRFLQKVRDMQFEHLQEIYNRQQKGEMVEMTPTFSREERKYLRRRKALFLGAIFLKVMIVLALFSLLFNQ